jgi:XTP/dITP diphosphohydrolase
MVLASANPDKAAEIAAIVADSAGERIVLVARPPEVPDVDETGTTLEENALLKAEALVKATGLAAIADDTGLEVESLGGAPGVYSARYSGENAKYADNVNKLVAELEKAGATEPSQRRARFRTVAVALYPDGRQVVADGVVDGTIAPEPRGDGGFGYDPVFSPDGSGGRTFAQMTSSEKHEISHRGRAFRALVSKLGD